MLRSKGYIKKTKKGNVVKVVQEHYLRDDIWCSVEFCSLCSHTQPELIAAPSVNELVNLPHLIVPDTNVFKHQVRLENLQFEFREKKCIPNIVNFKKIDIIESPVIQNVIVLQTVYEELR